MSDTLRHEHVHICQAVQQSDLGLYMVRLRSVLISFHHVAFAYTTIVLIVFTQKINLFFSRDMLSPVKSLFLHGLLGYHHIQGSLLWVEFQHHLRLSI